MTEFPSEIIEDILLKLPVKSLIRFRCVSKSWRSLITHPRFVRMHVNHNLTDSYRNSFILQFYSPSPYNIKIAEVGVTQKEDKEMTQSPFDLQEMPQSPFDLPNIVSPDNHYIVKGSCDGILCLFQGCDTLLLWNPRIGEYKRLALPKFFAGPLEVIGFGYDSSIDDYKVVRVPSYYCDNLHSSFKVTTVVEVLTLSSNYWRSLNDDFPFSIDSQQKFICANGGICWFTDDTILFFDLKKEKFNEVPLPTDIVAEEFIISSLGTLGGCLCMLGSMTLNRQLDRKLDLWVMKGDTWVKLVSIPNLSGLDSKSWFTPLVLTKEGAVLMDFGNLSSRKFINYEPKDNTFKKITLDGIKSWFQLIVYAESLVSPWAGNWTISIR